MGDTFFFCIYRIKNHLYYRQSETKLEKKGALSFFVIYLFIHITGILQVTQEG